MSNPTAAISSEPESSSSDSFMVLWSITAPQKTFLADRLSDYKAALGKKSLPEFWDTLFEDWFKRWPSKDDGRALVEEQLKSWMVTNNRWHITTKQHKFLTDRIPDYKSAQAKKKLIDFWPFLYMHWFDRWPATEVAPQGLVEKKLKAWYNNNARVTASTRQVLNLNKPAKRTRRPAAAQTFCKVYWSKPLPNGTVLRNTITAEWVAAWQKSKKFDPQIDVPRVAINFINKVTHCIFLKQLPPIHEEIEQHPDQLKHDNSEGSPDPGDEAEDDEVKRALEYQA
ncbi:hypothetical protein BDN71DRAFT_1435608 [Pleurotus eryngii]|uniref:Uncharacterized protein n=1 Tax=Pleurotus eryngii TaxID=5323 RepID=A0A9P6DAX2_PLEER|nr:hypothetical protein BDN71DRAFT_1435608 [Pleurotus eryngii]